MRDLKAIERENEDAREKFIFEWQNCPQSNSEQIYNKMVKLTQKVYPNF